MANMQTVIETKLGKLGYVDAAVDIKGDGTIEVMAFVAGNPDNPVYYMGRTQGAPKWVNSLPNVTVVAEPEPILEAVSEEELAWEEQYGAITDEDIARALAEEEDAPAQEQKEEVVEELVALVPQAVQKAAVVPQNIQIVEEETEMTEETTMSLPSLVEEPVAAPKAKKGGFLARLLGKEEKADTTTTLPTLVPELQANPLFVAKLNAARKNGDVLRIGYISQNGNVTTRLARVANVVEDDDKFYLYDLKEYTLKQAAFAAEMPTGTTPYAIARAASKAAERTFRLSRVLSISDTGKKEGPLNPLGSKAVIMRPATKEAVSRTGNGFPRQVSPASVVELSNAGYVLVPAGE